MTKVDKIRKLSPRDLENLKEAGQLQEQFGIGRTLPSTKRNEPNWGTWENREKQQEAGGAEQNE